MRLKDATNLMWSKDYKDRFKAEYWQLKIRYEGLNKIITSYELKTIKFKLSCPIALLKKQRTAMKKYLLALEQRAKIENIDLKGEQNGKLNL